MILSAPMRQALVEARRGPLRRLHDDQPGKPPWPAPPASLAALVSRGLLETGTMRSRKGWHIDTWTITDAGREAIAPPAARSRPDHPRFLARPTRSTPDYTTNPSRAIDNLEPVSDELLATYAADAEQRRAGDPGRREEHLRREAHTLATRLRKASFAAAAGDDAVDITSHLDQIKQHVDALERAREAA